MSGSPTARCANCGTAASDKPSATCTACGHPYFTLGGELFQWVDGSYVAAATEPAACSSMTPPAVAGTRPRMVPVIRGTWSILPATAIFAVVGCLVASLVAAGVALTRESAVDRAVRVIITSTSEGADGSDTLTVIEHLDDRERAQVARVLRERATGLATAPAGTPRSRAEATAIFTIAADLNDAESARSAAELAVNDANSIARSDPQGALAEYRRGSALFHRAAELYNADGISEIAEACRLNEQACLRSITEIMNGGVP